MAADIVDLDAYRNYPVEPKFCDDRPLAPVVEFHQRLVRCTICGSPHHRASKCKIKPSAASAPETQHG